MNVSLMKHKTSSVAPNAVSNGTTVMPSKGSETASQKESGERAYGRESIAGFCWTRGRGRCQAAPQVARTTSSVGMISLAASWPPMRSSTLRASSTPPWCQSWRTLVSGGAKLCAAGESS